MKRQQANGKPAWRLPPSHLRLSADEIHVWRFFLNVSNPILDSLGHALSSDENSRANRFRFEIDRDRFIASRGCLRTILSIYLGSAPSEIRFSYGVQGKPSLNQPSTAKLHFNLAHSGDLSLYAVTLERQIGVDLEEIKPGFATAEIAESFFSASEIARLRSLDADEQNRAFLTAGRGKKRS